MRVSILQLEIHDRPRPDTLRHVLTLLDRTRGSDLVLLPELWPTGYYSFARYHEDSETIDGPTVTALQAMARDLGVYLFTGSFVERDGDGLYNTCLLLDSSGQVIARYRKMHLFGHQSEERRQLRPGREVVVVPTPWGKAGFAICYDLRFPELFRRMIDAGAEFFLVAAAWPVVRRESWLLLNRARANENLAFVFACNAAGTNQGTTAAGHSLIVDPLGKVLAKGPDGEAIISADVDLAAVQQIRKDFPALDDRMLR
jgi:predicted amidohydrolase